MRGIFIERLKKGYIEYYNNYSNGSWHGICNTATKYKIKEDAQKDIDMLKLKDKNSSFRIFVL